MSYRNLGGSAVQYADVTPKTGTLTTIVKSTRIALSGGMIIQNFDLEVWSSPSPHPLPERGKIEEPTQAEEVVP